MRSFRLKLSTIAFLIAGWAISTPLIPTASAMPNFARKYSLGCSSCHAVVPRLNEFGWKFRAAGYRMPDEIGQKQPQFNLGDYIAGRMNFSIAQTSATKAAPGSPTVNNLSEQFTGASLYPIFGALTKNISSEMELGFKIASPTNNGTNKLTFPVSVSTASVGYYSGNEDAWFLGRIGIINILQGYGGSDRGWSGSPLMNTGYPISIPAYEANDNKPIPGYTGLTGSNMGIDLGYVYKEATIHAEILSGYAYDATDNPYAALGGGALKTVGAGAGANAGQAPSANTFDYMFWGNYILTEDGGGISAALYLGQADLPTNATVTKSAPIDSSYWTNKFKRYAVYASYPIVKFLLMGGYEGGTDDSWTLGTNPDGKFTNGPVINSHGYFGELDYPVTDLIGVGVRYDAVTPDGSQSSMDNIHVVTGYCDYNFGDGLQLTGTYTTKRTNTPASNGSGGVEELGTAKNSGFTLGISWIQ